MTRIPQSTFAPHEAVRLLATYWRRWLITACLVTVAAGAYAFLGKPSWQASQTLILRNEAANADTGPGKFGRTEDLKSLQETLLELARSQGVLEAVLHHVGPPAGYDGKDVWPAPLHVDALRRLVTLVPPKGVEFGTAEVFHLEVRDTDRVRAGLLDRALSDQLQVRFQEIRDAKAQSMIDELSKTVQLAQSDLAETTTRLAKIEKHLGSDLGDLRGMHDAASGDSALRRTAAEIDGDLRHARATEQANRQLLGMLRRSMSDPGQLLAVPSRLLDSQPALKRLKDGLVDAQLRTARLKGRMSSAHPLVIAAEEAQQEVARHVHDELAVVAGSLEAELRLDERRIAILASQLGQTTGRLERLAGLRAEYANLVAETNHRTKLVERAEQNMAEARASRASAKAASLISRIDGPDTGIRPVSPSPATILVAGILGGLVAGFGVVMLTVAPRRLEEAPAIGGRPAEPLPLAVRPQAVLPAVLSRGARNGKLSLTQALEKAIADRARLTAMQP
ncbi:MAG: Wzz/FepE/Etk N-terminal domain-containing protein [Thermoguttaceae bacterium]|jgi:uncharacterized protein involved in exopolysaccharide biosynthesis